MSVGYNKATCYTKYKLNLMMTNAHSVNVYTESNYWYLIINKVNKVYKVNKKGKPYQSCTLNIL